MWYRFVGADRPASIEQWEVFGATTARTVAVSFPNHLPPGTRVWIAAASYNPRGEQGPPQPRRTHRSDGRHVRQQDPAGRRGVKSG